MVKIADGQVANRPIYVVVGVTVDGERDILGLRAVPVEGAKFWHQVLTEVRNRGVADDFQPPARDVGMTQTDNLTETNQPEQPGNDWVRSTRSTAWRPGPVVRCGVGGYDL